MVPGKNMVPQSFQKYWPSQEGPPRSSKCPPHPPISALSLLPFTTLGPPPPSTSWLRCRALPCLVLETAAAGGFTAHRPEPCSWKTRKKSKGEEYSNFDGAGERGYQIAAEYRLKGVEPGLAWKLMHRYCLCKVILGQSACGFQ